MARRLIPYGYRPGNTVLHRAPGGIKLLGLLIVSVSALRFGQTALALISLLIITFSLSAGIRPVELLRGSRPLLVMLILVVILRSVEYDPPAFNRRGCAEGLLFAWALISSFCAGALLFSVTTMAELRDSLGRIGGRRLSLAISLMLGFIPRFFETWDAVSAAYQARGGKKGIPAMLTLIPLAIEGMLAGAAETAQALEARGLDLRGKH
jgi:biotin transport system permease protein